ncbi:hypothetical protein [Chryseolinea lacunae]|uniref:Uncharacterized protein n=1 Tax=Chryseolinea lacunae TaxID=2801331 RepID=A0ABS1KVJ3_9BACT|nr:hypothetical protein [Chryseolinea lacunae]MBL0743489.1 hypothetical protein [Chryseolinea lacunae]
MTAPDKIAPGLPPFLTPEIIEKLAHLFDVASASDLRETLLELYHIYIRREHEALHVRFADMALHVDLLSDLLKAIEKTVPTHHPANAAMKG